MAKVKLLRHGEAETVQYLHNAIGQTTLEATKPVIENNQRFPGQYFDSETGLNQNGPPGI